MYVETIERGGMICEREMSSAGGRKQLKKVMTECPMVENSKEPLAGLITLHKSLTFTDEVCHSDVLLAIFLDSVAIKISK